MLNGKVVKQVRQMTPAELEAEGWDNELGYIAAIEFTDGTAIYASQDEEGNGPGALFGREKNGKTFGIIIIRRRS
jgi:hypothetical protein